jgi:AcrR family transcriptional regulator
METSHDVARRAAMPQRGNYNKRCKIIAAATKVFCRDGFTGTSIDAVAAEAGVSRQTIYNQMIDKETLFAEVVRGITERSSAVMVGTLATFPDKPSNIEAELIEFAVRLTRNCICDDDAVVMRKLIENEGRRYPELFATWRDYGPGKNWPAIAARFTRLARAGEIHLDDPELAARQFMALIGADLPESPAPGEEISDAALRRAATNAVKTFMRAFPAAAPRSQARETA